MDSDLVDMGGRSPEKVLEDESDAVGADYKHDQVPETFRATGSSGMNLFSLNSRTPSSHRSVFMSKLAVRLWCETNLCHYLSLRVPDAHSDENSAVAGSVVPPTTPQPRHYVEKKKEETSEFEEPPRRFGQTQRLRLLVLGRTANYAGKRGARDEVLAKPFFTTLAITALLAHAHEFAEPKTFGDVKGLPDKAEWIAACHEETAIWIEKSLGTVSARHASCGHSRAAVPMSLHSRKDSMAQCGAKRDSLFVETTSGTWT
jgi:hypothetical protein